MPNPSSYYTSPTGSAHVPLPPPPPSAAYALPPQVFAVGAVVPSAAHMNQSHVSRAQPDFYSSSPQSNGYLPPSNRALSPPLAAPASNWGYGGQPQPQQQPAHPVQQQQVYSQQQQKLDFGATSPLDPYTQQHAGQHSPGAYGMSSPIDRKPPPPVFLLPQHHQHHQQLQQQQKKAPPPAEDLDDAYGGM